MAIDGDYLADIPENNKVDYPTKISTFMTQVGLDVTELDTNKADKAGAGPSGNIALLDANGNLLLSGSTPGGTSSGDIADIDTSQTMTNKTILAANNILDARVEDIAGVSPTVNEFIGGTGSIIEMRTATQVKASLGLSTIVVDDATRATKAVPVSDVNIAVLDGVTGELEDGGNTIAQVLARANHTGSQTMSTISDAGALATIGSAGLQDVQIFPESGSWTWTNPNPGVITAIEVICIGAGGGAGSTTTSNTTAEQYGATGGGGGAAYVYAYFTSGFSNSEDIVVGAGGAGGATGASGATGGVSSFSDGTTIEVIAAAGVGSSGVSTSTGTLVAIQKGGFGGSRASCTVTAAAKNIKIAGCRGFNGQVTVLGDTAQTIVANRASGGFPVMFGIPQIDAFAPTVTTGGTVGQGTGSVQDHGQGGTGSYRFYNSTATTGSSSGGAGSKGLVIVKSYI